jgi:hypothetical protein
MEQTHGYWTITPQAMLQIVNDKRRELGRTPIDHTVMTTRLVLRSQVICPGLFDFRAAQIRLDGESLSVLEELLNEQFDLYLRGELSRRCKFRPAETPRPSPTTVVPVTSAKLEPSGGALVARLKRLFGLNRQERAG